MNASPSDAYIANKQLKLFPFKKRLRLLVNENANKIDLGKLNNFFRTFNRICNLKLLKFIKFLLFNTYDLLNLNKLKMILEYLYMKTLKYLDKVKKKDNFKNERLNVYKSGLLTVIYDLNSYYQELKQTSMSLTDDSRVLYHDCVTPLLSIYIDLILISNPNVDLKHNGRKLCTHLYFLLDSSIERICETLLAVSLLNESNIFLLTYTVRKIFNDIDKLPDRLGNQLCLKLILTYKKLEAISSDFAKKYKENLLLMKPSKKFREYIKHIARQQELKIDEEKNNFLENFIQNINKDEIDCYLKSMRESIDSCKPDIFRMDVDDHDDIVSLTTIDENESFTVDLNQKLINESLIQLKENNKNLMIIDKQIKELMNELLESMTEVEHTRCVIVDALHDFIDPKKCVSSKDESESIADSCTVVYDTPRKPDDDAADYRTPVNLVSPKKPDELVIVKECPPSTTNSPPKRVSSFEERKNNFNLNIAKIEIENQIELEATRRRTIKPISFFKRFQAKFNSNGEFEIPVVGPKSGTVNKHVTIVYDKSDFVDSDDDNEAPHPSAHTDENNNDVDEKPKLKKNLKREYEEIVETKQVTHIVTDNEREDETYKPIIKRKKNVESNYNLRRTNKKSYAQYK